MEIFKKVALTITIIGALNWMLIGIFDINIVTELIKNEMIDKLIYIIIGIAGLVSITYLLENEKKA